MRRTSPAVTIRSVRANSGMYLHFSAARSGCPDLRVTLDDETVLREARADLDLRLTALKGELSGLEVTDADAPEVYRRFWQIGNRQLFLIFHRAVVEELTRWWRSALIAARNPRYLPMIECVGELGAMLPIEYLPLLEPRPADVRNRADLIRACRTVVGFNCVVRRSFGNLPVPQNITLRLDERGRLPVRFFQHDGLPGAKLELRWFSTAAERHAEVTSYPDGTVDGRSLGDQISDPSADALQHFACHCYTSGNRPMANEIELSGGGRTVRVTLDDLITEVAGHFGREHLPAEMPLVVMNACGASRLAAGSALSFPWFFLRNDNRGFVGSEIEIPDDLAAEFSTALYTRFILVRESIGAAVHHARNHLLDKYGNPLGISYSTYVDPDLRVGTDPWEEP